MFRIRLTHWFCAVLLIAMLAIPSGQGVSASGSAGRPAGPVARGIGEAGALPTNQIIIKFKDDNGRLKAPAGEARLRRLSAAAGVQITAAREMSGGALVLRLPGRMPYGQVQAFARRLAALDDVAYAEPDAILQHTMTPNDPYYSYQWHYNAPSSGDYGINAPAAWDITTGSPGIVVAVIDTGITNHADLAGRTVPGYDFIADVWTANDGNGRDADPSDPGDWTAANDCFTGSTAEDSSWHGTHVAGTIGAVSNNGVGVTGINWNSKILPVRVLGRCGGFVSDIVDGMRWAAGLPVAGVPANPNPAKVLNLSLGGSGACTTAQQSAINAITAAGATVVVAAGNAAVDASTANPGNCNGVITVAATDRHGDMAYYSNYGTAVEIAAPGGDARYVNSGVLSTLNTGTTGPVADTYVYYQGTSMAAPHVAGIVSLMVSLNPALTPAQVVSVLQSTATAFPPGSTCTTSLCGSGIANAGAAVAAVAGPTLTATVTTITSHLPDPSNVGQDVVISYTVAPTSGSGTPTGTVTVSDGTQSCSATVAAGHCAIAFTSSGTKTLAATYSGDANFKSSASPGAQHVVNQDTASNLLLDPGFELYTSASSPWVQYSKNFTTPLCTFADCGGGEPHTGSVWAWFGGTNVDELGYVQQAVTIPASSGLMTLRFFFMIPFADTGSGADDTFRAMIDSTVLFSADATQQSAYANWQEISVNAAAFADGAPHTVRFESTTFGQTVSFFVDDVALSAPAGPRERLLLPLVSRP